MAGACISALTRREAAEDEVYRIPHPTRGGRMLEESNDVAESGLVGADAVTVGDGARELLGLGARRCCTSRRGRGTKGAIRLGGGERERERKLMGAELGLCKFGPD